MSSASISAASTTTTTTAAVSIDQMQRANWEGSIPVVVSLAPTSLSSPTAPPPIHVLLSRQTYLHLGLQSAIRRLYPFAPTSFSFRGGTAVTEPEPGHESDGDEQAERATQPKSPSKQQQQKEEYSCPLCWFEDEESQLPLRWHLFAGVLYDLVHFYQSSKNASLLPWRLRLHFTNYPDSVLLPLSAGQVEAQIRAMFQNSLKQAITLRTGQSKAALQLLTKEAHQMLWQALQQQDSSSSGRYYSLYRQVANDLSSKLGIGSSGSSTESSSSSVSKNNSRIPIRLLLGETSHTSIQKSCLATRALTLRQLLLKWLPSKYIVQDNNSLVEGVICLVQGIEPPLETSVLELWQYLCHADHFLYIIVHVWTGE